jgi:hypothetical protein
MYTAIGAYRVVYLVPFYFGEILCSLISSYFTATNKIRILHLLDVYNCVAHHATAPVLP